MFYPGLRASCLVAAVRDSVSFGAFPPLGTNLGWGVPSFCQFGFLWASFGEVRGGLGFWRGMGVSLISVRINARRCRRPRHS